MRTKVGEIFYHLRHRYVMGEEIASKETIRAFLLDGRPQGEA